MLLVEVGDVGDARLEVLACEINAVSFMFAQSDTRVVLLVEGDFVDRILRENFTQLGSQA